MKRVEGRAVVAVHQDWPWREDFSRGLCMLQVYPMRNCIGNSPHGSKKFVSFTSSSPLNAMSTWGGSVETRKWATWPGIMLDPKVNPPSCKVSAEKDLDIEVFFPYFDMFPCQKGFRHATGIGDYGWLMIIMVICLVHSFLLLSIWCFFHLFVSYSQTILCLSVDGLPRTEDCEFEESLLGATWEFFV